MVFVGVGSRTELEFRTDCHEPNLFSPASLPFLYERNCESRVSCCWSPSRCYDEVDKRDQIFIDEKNGNVGKGLKACT